MVYEVGYGLRVTLPEPHSTIATDTAQIIFTDASLKHLPNVFDLANSLDRNMKYNLALTIIPAVICIGGVYFLHFGVIAATLVYNADLAAGVFNAMLPAFSEHNRSAHQEETQRPKLRATP